MMDGFSVFPIFYTHRTNSVEQFGTSTLSLREKVFFCEAEYARLGSPAIFKISPLVSPDFDYLLEKPQLRNPAYNKCYGSLTGRSRSFCALRSGNSY